MSGTVIIELQLDKRATLADVRCFISAYRCVDNYYLGHMADVLNGSTPTFDAGLAPVGTDTRRRQLGLIKAYRHLFVRATLYRHSTPEELDLALLEAMI